MDFELSDEQQAVRALAGRILADQLTPEHLRALETGGDWFAEATWRDLGTAGLLGLAVPEPHGGAGLGVLEACLVAEELGRRVAPLPYLACAIGAALPIARFGTDTQRERWLPGLLSGGERVTAALHEPVEVEIPATPSTVAVRDGDRWRLTGTKAFVPLATGSSALLVPARTEPGVSTVFVVPRERDGLRFEDARAVTGEPLHLVHLEAVEAGGDDVLGPAGDGAAVVAWTVERLVAAACAMQTGVCEEALALTAAHVNQREQFGVKLGTFQAVGHRVADAYIDTEAVRLTALQAAWQVDQADRDATDALLVARFWAAEGAQRVVHAAQHLHGGIGVDLDHPVHRYFRWAKVLELFAGGATPALRRLGARIADRSPA